MSSSPYQPPSDMTPDQKALIDKENECRRLFAEEPTSTRLSDPHLLLVNVYDNYDSFHFTEESPEELLTHYRRLDLKGSAIVPKDTFLSNWNEFTQGCLNGLDWTNVFVAGGAVLGCLSSEQDGYRSSDIDLFVWGITDENEANEKLKSIYNTVLNNTKGKGDVIRTKRAITILCSYPYRHVQVILRLYKSPAEVLLGFDIDSCCVGFDGKDIWCQERFKRALTKRYNLVNTSRRSLTYESRLFKYSKRGFAVAVPNLDKSRVDTRIFSKDFKQVSGLAKLVLYDFKQGSKSSAFSKPRAKAIPEEGSDYNNDLPIPWGPNWNTDVILNLLQSKNRAKFFASVRKNKDEGATGEQTSKKPYNHMFTSDAAGLKAGNFETWKRSLDSKEVNHPLEWIKDNPAYQDYDNGFRRLMTGSFEPVVDANWESEVYLPNGASAPPAVLAQKYLSTDDSSIVDSKNSPGKGYASLGFQPSPKKPTQLRTKMTQPAPSFGGFPATPSFPSSFGSASTTAVPCASTASKAASSTLKSVSTTLSSTQPSTSTGISFGVPPAARPSTGSFPATTNFSQPPSFSTAYLASSVTSTPAEPSTSGFYSLDNNSVRKQLEESRKDYSPKKATAKADVVELFGPQPGSFVQDWTPATPTRQHTFDLGQTTPPPSPSVRAFSTFGNTSGEIPQTQPQSQPDLASFVPTPFPPPSFPISQVQQQQQQQPQPSPLLFHPQYQPQAFGAPTVVRVGGVSPTPASPTTKMLLVIALLAKKGLISADEKGVLKDLTLSKDELVFAALEVFEIDQDLNELADTLRRVCKVHTR